MGATDCIFALVKMEQAAPAINSAEQHHYLYVSRDSIWTSCKGVDDL